MDAIFQWAQNHEMFATAIGGIICIILYAIPNTAVKILGMKVSQIIRHLPGGARLEKAVEEKVGAFDEGMKGDNAK